VTALLTPAPAQRRAERVRAPLVTIGALAAATVALHYRDPHVSGSWGFCPSAAIGFWCPGCGGLRAVHDLTDGNLGAAASSNLLLVVLAPLAVLALATWLVVRWRGTELRLPRSAVLVGGGVLLAATGLFTLLRNTPVAPWLAP